MRMSFRGVGDKNKEFWESRKRKRYLWVKINIVTRVEMLQKKKNHPAIIYCRYTANPNGSVSLPNSTILIISQLLNGRLWRSKVEPAEPWSPVRQWPCDVLKEVWLYIPDELRQLNGAEDLPYMIIPYSISRLLPTSFTGSPPLHDQLSILWSAFFNIYLSSMPYYTSLANWWRRWLLSYRW